MGIRIERCRKRRHQAYFLLCIPSMNTVMIKLLLEHPRALIESGVVIPCALRGLLDCDDDEALRTVPLPAAVESPSSLDGFDGLETRLARLA